MINNHLNGRTTYYRVQILSNRADEPFPTISRCEDRHTVEWKVYRLTLQWFCKLPYGKKALESKPWFFFLMGKFFDMKEHPDL